MRRVIFYIVLILSIAFVGSCKRDHLHYETNLYALIHIEVDWKAHTNLEPNGVSAYVFNNDDSRYSKVVLSSDPNNIYLKLPIGDYSVVLHNNSISELKGVRLKGADRFDTFGIYANSASYTPEFKSLDSKLFVDKSEDVASYTLHDVNITYDDVKYHYYKPDLADYEQEATYSYHVEPYPIVHRVKIIAYMDGEEFNSTKRPKGALYGMSGGYSFEAETTADKNVIEQFDFKFSPIISSSLSSDIPTRVGGAIEILDPDDENGFTDEQLEGMGVAYVEYSTFGMHSNNPDDHDYCLYMRFYLYDGTYIDYEADVTNYIKTENEEFNNLHTIELILTSLPDGGGEEGDGSWGPESDGDESDGVFDPSLDDWVDVGTDLPL